MNILHDKLNENFKETFFHPLNYCKTQKSVKLHHIFVLVSPTPQNAGLERRESNTSFENVKHEIYNIYITNIFTIRIENSKTPRNNTNLQYFQIGIYHQSQRGVKAKENKYN